MSSPVTAFLIGTAPGAASRRPGRRVEPPLAPRPLDARRGGTPRRAEAREVRGLEVELDVRVGREAQDGLERRELGREVVAWRHGDLLLVWCVFCVCPSRRPSRNMICVCATAPVEESHLNEDRSLRRRGTPAADVPALAAHRPGGRRGGPEAAPRRVSAADPALSSLGLKSQGWSPVGDKGVILDPTALEVAENVYFWHQVSRRRGTTSTHRP